MEIDKNRPESEGLVGRGPIPAGRYRIVGPPRDTPAHGPFVLGLYPDHPTRGRIVGLGRDPDSFLMHGDSLKHAGTASEGCVIMPLAVRVKVWDRNPVDPDLEVVSGYPASDVDGEIAT